MEEGGEKGTHAARWEMSVYLCSQFCVVYVFVMWEMHFAYLHVAVLFFSCSCAVGNVVLVRCWHSRVEGHACLHIFVWVRCCHSLTVGHVCLHIFVVVVAGILVNTVSASDPRSEGWGIESPCPYISDVRIR